MIHFLPLIMSLVIKAPQTQTWWTQQTYSLEKRMEKIGWSEENSRSIINECKKTALNPHRCVVYASAIWANETKEGKKARNHSLFWIWKKFDSDKKSIIYWVKMWNKHWYKCRNVKHFYSPVRWVKPKSYYCLSEVQPSGIKLPYCPNWYAATNYFIKKLLW